MTSRPYGTASPPSVAGRIRARRERLQRERNNTASRTSRRGYRGRARATSWSQCAMMLYLVRRCARIVPLSWCVSAGALAQHLRSRMPSATRSARAAEVALVVLGLLLLLCITRLVALLQSGVLCLLWILCVIWITESLLPTVTAIISTRYWRSTATPSPVSRRDISSSSERSVSNSLVDLAVSDDGSPIVHDLRDYSSSEPRTDSDSTSGSTTTYQSWTNDWTATTTRSMPSDGYRFGAFYSGTAILLKRSQSWDSSYRAATSSEPFSVGVTPLSTRLSSSNIRVPSRGHRGETSHTFIHYSRRC